ncbi:MAG: hypothetical protein MJZ90_04975 [Bacteroidales bacterium]|nr:hypothetical protein [Bacteroidales bacterium]
MKKLSIALLSLAVFVLVMNSCKKEEMPQGIATVVTVTPPTVKFKNAGESYITTDAVFQQSLAKFDLSISASTDIDDVIDSLVISIPGRADSIVKGESSYAFNTKDKGGKSVVLDTVGTYTISAKLVTIGGRTAEKEINVEVIDDIALADSNFTMTKNDTEAAVLSTDEIGLQWTKIDGVKENPADEKDLYAVIEPKDGYTLYKVDFNYGHDFNEFTMYPDLVAFAASEFVSKINSFNEINITEGNVCEFAFIVKDNKTKEYVILQIEEIGREDRVFTLSGRYKKMAE